jgi:hypothetical protein
MGVNSPPGRPDGQTLAKFTGRKNPVNSMNLVFTIF